MAEQSSPQTVSVIVVSRHRPDALRRCLLGLQQLYYQGFEIIVVACDAGIASVTDMGLADQIKLIAFEKANISAARNLGLAVAAGDIVAFIDDDAVAEPTWLDYLSAPFDDPDVSAAGGYVRGRNGISFQSRAQSVNSLGQQAPLEMQGDVPTVFKATQDRAIKTEGTNCAFRRETLLALGGFDPAFRFYLDETDVNLRLGKIHAKTAIAPMAQVHHGFAPSKQRHQNRMPRTLFDVGCSMVVFLRKHAEKVDHEPTLSACRQEQRARLLRDLVAGTCEPRDVDRVLQTLEAGIAEGRDVVLTPPAKLVTNAPAFLPFRSNFTEKTSTVLTGRAFRKSRLCDSARKLAKSGQRVSVFCLSPTALYHRVSFEDPGFWLQTGGIFGRSIRETAICRWISLKSRIKLEASRVQPLRKFRT